MQWPIETVNCIDTLADLGPVKAEGYDVLGIALVARATIGDGSVVDVQVKNGDLIIDASRSSSSGSLFVKPQGPYSTISVNGRTNYIPGDSMENISMVNDRVILNGVDVTDGEMKFSIPSGDVKMDSVLKGTVSVETRSGDIKLSAFEPVMKSARLSTISGAVSKNTIEDRRSIGEMCSAIFSNYGN